MQRCIGGEQEIAGDKPALAIDIRGRIFHPLRNYYYARELPGLGSTRFAGNIKCLIPTVVFA